MSEPIEVFHDGESSLRSSKQLLRLVAAREAGPEAGVRSTESEAILNELVDMQRLASAVSRQHLQQIATNVLSMLHAATDLVNFVLNVVSLPPDGSEPDEQKALEVRKAVLREFEARLEDSAST